MSAQTIYARLVQAGMSPVGACAMLGNMDKESALRANNVQDGMGYSDEDYTAAVDAGLIDFVADGRGYGLCQWTYGARKRNLLEFARGRGVSVGDEDMQVDFCIEELKKDYPSLWTWLCAANGVYETAKRICLEYERPAEPNIQERAECANEWYMRLGGMQVSTETTDNTTTPTAIDWPPRELEYGMTGGDVIALQGLLFAHGYRIAIDGDYGNKTKNAVAGFQADVFGYGDGKCTYSTWDALFEF